MTKQNKTRVILIIIILILALFGTFIYRSNKLSLLVPTPAKTNPNAVTYYCQEGMMQAVYGKDNVILSLKDGRTLTLPQVISGSGMRYELGTTTLVGKGDNALLTENKVDTYTKCVTGLQTTKGNTNTYTDTAKTFSFSYPSQFPLSGGDIGYSQDWTANTPNLGILFTVVHIPKSLLPQTNFSEAKFTVGTSSDPDAIKNCLVATNGEKVATSEVTINGRNFTKVTLSDAGAGNFYDTTSYRTIFNDQCYSIEYTIHSTNIGNYSPDQGIIEFDQTKVVPLLESMAKSFKFL